MSAEKNIVHLHCHTDYSLLDGCAKVSRYMKRCQELGMPALAMTDHGNLFGAMNFYKAATKAGVKPLIGCEIYLVYDHKQADRPKRDRARSDDINDIPEDELGPESYPKYQIHHKTLIARNFTGYQNLVKLVSDAHVNGVYYRPRCDMETLAQYSEGIIGLSGCMNGVASQKLIYNDYAGARQAMGEFIDIFGKENYFVEIQDHGMPVQRRITPGLLKLAKEFDLPVVAANDVHYVYKEDSEPHDALLCIQTGKLVKDEKRMKYPSREFYLKSYEEMLQVFREVPEALDNTLRVAEMVDFKIDFGEDHYPIYERPIEVTYPADEPAFGRILDIYVREKNKVLERDGKPLISLTPEEREKLAENGTYLLELCKGGLKERYGVDYDQWVALGRDEPTCELPEGYDLERANEVCKQLEYELAIITGAGFVDYFLITWDFINWARSQGIPVGPGRGSGAGCMVAYLIKITDIDPLRFGLLFERMLSLERVSPPDFDVDFCMRRRDEVVDYVRDKYGKDRVANIITYGTFGAKMVVRDLARVLDIPFAEANRVAKMVPDDLNISLDDAVAKSHDLQAEMGRNETVREIIKQGKVIEGMVRNTGKHACGIIIGDQPLTNLVPVTLQEGDLTTQYAKGPVEDLGMLKADFLGLKTLTVISDAQDHIRRTTDWKDFDIEKVTLEDAAAYQLLNEGKTKGVFQLESGGMQALCRQLGLSTFEEIIALIALYRPGPMQFIPQYIEGKKDASKVKSPHPLLDELVQETYGILVYQEQVMKVAQIIAGYTLGNADILRRAMGKKIASVMAEQKDIFIKGAKETNDIERPKAEEIFGILEKFAQYGFNKSHSAAYAMLSYRTAYLKANYPVQFMAAVLGCEMGNAEKMAGFLEECQAINVPVLGPNVNESRESFTPIMDADGKSGSIRFGLAAIKGVGEAPAHAIIEEREQNGPFASFKDFAQRIDSSVANRRVLESLVKAGAFDDLGQDRGTILHLLDGILNEIKDLQRDKERGQTNLFDMFGMEEPEPAPTTNEDGEEVNGPIMPMMEKLQFEKELLGFYVSGHPLNDFQGLCQHLDTFQDREFEKMENREPYRLCGVITGVARKISRRDNRPWAIISLSTKDTTYTVNCYADAYERNKDMVEEGALIMLEGTVARRPDEVQLLAERLLPLEQSVRDLVKELTFVIEGDGAAVDFLRCLREELEPQSGSTSVKVGVLFAPDQIAVADIAGSLGWNLNQRQFGKLRRHPAVRDVLLQVPQPEAPRPRWERKSA
ncbi:MAG: DNA polymerase III subunit alpha [Puniceicoccaceae bacterium 5H]|nr:MAG: DNA polymerase III subunit alpha [Puniceicoccaceae bacterium 5H]